MRKIFSNFHFFHYEEEEKGVLSDICSSFSLSMKNDHSHFDRLRGNSKFY